MKKNGCLFVIASLALLFTSCTKDNSTGDYYISAKVNGELKTYSVAALALNLKVDTIYSLTFNANASIGSQERFFLTIFQTNVPITTGTYVDEGDGNNNLLVAGGYNPGTTDGTKLYAAGLQQDNNPRLTINLTLTEKTVSGTFSGTYYDNGGAGPGTIAITEGKFNLPVTQ